MSVSDAEAHHQCFIVCMFYQCDVIHVKFGFYSVYPKTIG